jgi:hypothetical protein
MLVQKRCIGKNLKTNICGLIEGNYPKNLARGSEAKLGTTGREKHFFQFTSDPVFNLRAVNAFVFKSLFKPLKHGSSRIYQQGSSYEEPSRSE